MEEVYTMKRGSILFLKGSICTIGLTVLFLSTCILPALAQKAALLNPEYAYLQYPVLFGIWITVIPFFIALYEAFKLLNYTERAHLFCNKSTLSLTRIRRCAGTIIGLYMIGMVSLAALNALHPGIAILGLLIVFVTLIILALSFTLQKLLNNAIALKTENDLTV
jgi:Protein of unknown function (DUF2975)